MCHCEKPANLRHLVQATFLAHKKDVYDIAGGHLNPSNLRTRPQGKRNHWRSSSLRSRGGNPYRKLKESKDFADELLVKKLGFSVLKNGLVDHSERTKGTLSQVQPKRICKKERTDMKSALSEIQMESFVLSELAKVNHGQEGRAKAHVDLQLENVTVPGPAPLDTPLETYILSELQKSEQGECGLSKRQTELGPLASTKKSDIPISRKTRRRVLTETLKPTEVMLPSVDENARVPPSLRHPHPTMKRRVQVLTDKVYLTTYLAGVTRKDQFRKSLDFDRNVLHRYEEKETNLRDGHRAAEHLEQKLIRRLLELNMKGDVQSCSVNFGRLGAYSEIWDDLCADSSIFGPLLLQIKGVYDRYFSKLLKVVQAADHDGLVKCLDLADGLTRYSEPDAKHKREIVETLEEEGRNGILKNAELLRLIEREKERIAEKKRQREMEESRRRVFPLKRVKMKSSPSQQETKPLLTKKDMCMEERFQELRTKISKDIDAISHTRHELKTKYTPKILYRNALLAIQDTENRMQKLLQQNEYFTENAKIQEDLLETELSSYEEIDIDTLDELLSTSDTS